MAHAPHPDNEPARLQALRELHVLDTPSDPHLDEITTLAAEVCSAPVAAISFLDAEREWLKSCIGANLHELKRDTSFCAYAILQSSVLEISDARADTRFSQLPFVVGKPHLLFYAGAPLATRGGFLVGVLCVLDTTPRKLTNVQWRCLKVLSKAIMCRLECKAW
jgi:GAF domain-containing protein